MQSDTTIIEIIDLHPFELELIKSIRQRWRFGEMTIQVREGLPYRIKRVEEFIDLAKTGTEKGKKPSA